jgi:hypothetical protein
MATSPILFGNFADAGDSIIPTLAGEQNEGIHEIDWTFEKLIPFESDNTLRLIK